MPRKMPAQRPGRSETVVATPDDFMKEVKKYFGIKAFDIDLAADRTNTKAKRFITKEQNALDHDFSWRRAILSRQTAWLNPPYDHIEPWVRKAAQTGRSIFVLVPASVGSNWWRDWVDGTADVYLLNGRIKFVGHKTGYPKDLALLVYGGLVTGYQVWDWKPKQQKKRTRR